MTSTFAFPASIRRVAADDFEIAFRDLPEVVTGGADADAAWAQAPDALEAVAEAYIARGRALPPASELRTDERMIPLSLPVAARALLASAMAEQGKSKVAVAQAMGRDEKVVRRILSGRGASVELTLAALQAVGVRPVLSA